MKSNHATVMRNLDNIRALFCAQFRWTKGCSARKSDGSFAIPEAEEASCWCLVGACSKCCDYERENTRLLIRAACQSLFRDRCDSELVSDEAAFNDHPETTFQDVLKVLSEASKLATVEFSEMHDVGAWPAVN